MKTKTIISKDWLKRQKLLADKFKLSVNDIHNLYDVFYIIDMPFDVLSKMKVDFRRTLKINGLLSWYRDFFTRLDKICLDELEEKNK